VDTLVVDRFMYEVQCGKALKFPKTGGKNQGRRKVGAGEAKLYVTRVNGRFGAAKLNRSLLGENYYYLCRILKTKTQRHEP